MNFAFNILTTFRHTTNRLVSWDFILKTMFIFNFCFKYEFRFHSFDDITTNLSVSWDFIFKTLFIFSFSFKYKFLLQYFDNISFKQSYGFLWFISCEGDDVRASLKSQRLTILRREIRVFQKHLFITQVWTCA